MKNSVVKVLIYPKLGACQEDTLSQVWNSKKGVELTTKNAPLLQLTSEGVDNLKEVGNPLFIKCVYCHVPIGYFFIVRSG
jgi:hypothetical protein